MATTLLPMARGGKWIKPGNGHPVTYVAHEAHITRLLMEGGQVVEDPRPELLEKGLLKPHVPASTSSEAETALRAEVDQLKAMIAQLMAGKSDDPKIKK